MENKTHSLEDLFRVVVKHIWIVILAAIIGAGAALILRPSAKGMQTASAQVLVSPKQEFDISNGTLVDLSKSEMVLGKAIKKYNANLKDGKKIKYTDVFSTIQVVVTGNSRIITLTADEQTADNPKYLVSLVSEQLVTTSKKTLPVYNASVVSKSILTNQIAKSGFGKKKAIALGGGVGIFLGVALTFVFEMIKSRKRD